MLATSVHVTKVQEIPQFTPDNEIVKVIKYTFNVGKHGPFTLDYQPGADTPDVVQRDMNARVQGLVSAGVITAHEAGL